MAVKALIAGAALLPLTHCLPVPDVSATISCAIGPPLLSAADHLSPATGRWMLILVRSGNVLCGWQPGR